MSNKKCPECGKVLNVRGFCAWCGYAPSQKRPIEKFSFPQEV